MSSNLVEWSAPPSRRPTSVAMLPIAAGEGRRRPLLLAGVFTAVALAALLLGLLVPKKYTSTTTILVDEKGLPSSSSKASGSSGKLEPRAAAAREIALSRKVMLDILGTGGWLDDKPDAVARERLITAITRRLTVVSPRQLPNLVQISYTDDDPTRAFKVTQRLGELVIRESLAAKARESREAYEFLDSQAATYHQKLLESQARLSAYQLANPDARLNSEEEANRRIAELRRSVDLARMDLVNARAQEGTLSAQLGAENPVGVVQSRASQIQVRMAELQSEHERLLMNYTEQHPDVVRVRRQMQDLEADLRNESTRGSTRLAVASAGIPGANAFNPLYGEIKSRLSDARSRSAASASRVALGEGLLGEERTRSERIAAAEGTLAELTRNFEVNNDVYGDLLKRRENARVAMNLDIAGRGLSLRVQEPAAVPVRPDEGLRLMHVAIAGLVLAVAAPVLMLFGWLKVDSRVRTAAQIEQLAGLPVLGSIPPRTSGPQHARSRQRAVMAAALVLVVPIAYALVLALR